MKKNTNFNFNKLSPFKWFVLENFPFIEADFDALTEWQLFCKIGKEINKIIDSQNIVGEQAEQLTNSFNILYNYVHDYFDNLDVQEEINNKLNEMVEDGTLANILNNYTNVQKIYNTLQDLKLDENIVNNQKVKTLGYYNINDGGGAEYYITNISNNNVIQENLSNNLYANLIIKENINVKQLGAYGNGINDDTLAIEKAFNYQKILNLNYSEYIGSWESHLFPKIYNVYFPRGQYIYQGNGIEISDYGHLICIGDSKMTTSINIKENTVLFYSNNHINYLEIRNICFSGGKGVFNQRSNINDSESVTKNITDKFIIENCSFYDYTGCCIGSNFMDSPYWYINNNYFKGNETSIAIAMPGDSAGSIISNNDFILDKIHIKLQDGGRGIVIENNDFIRQTSNINLYDILILPCYYNGIVSGGSNAGLKCIIDKNKFGAEYIKNGDYKIIIANQYDYSSLTDYLTETRIDITNVKNGEINGLKVTKNNVFLNNNNVTPSIIFIACVKIKECEFEIFTNFADYIIEFSETIVNNLNNNDYVQSFLYVYMTNILNIIIKNPNEYLINSTNIKQYFHIKDNFNSLIDLPALKNARDPFYTLICSQNWGQPTSSSVENLVLETYENIYGISRGTKGTFTGNASMRFSVSNVQINKPLWIEFDIKSTGNIDKARINLLNTVNGDKPKLYKIIPINNEFKHIQLQVNNLNTSVNQMRIENINQTGEIYIENVSLYYSNTPINLNGGEQLQQLKLYNNENHNARISINGSDELIVTFADGTTKKITLQ